MTIEHMRGKLMFDIPKYNGPNWQFKVRNMPPHQVVALYNKFNKEEIFRGQRNANKYRQQLKQRQKDEKENHQITMFEYLEALKNETNSDDVNS